MPVSLRPLLRRPGPQQGPSRGSMVLAVPAAPATPSTPSPADTATALYTLLSWVSAGQAWADIYFSTSASPALAVAGYVGTSYVPTLLPGTTYYWKIVASNAGGSTTGPIWSFTTPAATAVLLLLAGVDVTARVRWGSCSIHDALNAAPNTADLTFDTTAPTEGEALKIGLGSLDDADLLFAGSIQNVGDQYVDHPDSALWPVGLVDYTFTLNKRRPFGTYVDVSATTVAIDWVTRFAPGFSTAGIQAGLPTVSITVDGSADFLTCFGRLATAIGGQCDVSYARVVSLCLADTTDPPDALDVTPPLNDPPIAFTTDLSQIRTKGYGKGHAETVPCDVAAGETIVPIADAVEFGTVASGGSAIAGTTAGGAQSDILTYADVQRGGAGSLVGPGVAPSVKPTAVVKGGGSIDTGSHDYAYVWGTAAGKSLPSPLKTVTTSTLLLDPPTAAPTVAVSAVSGSGLTPGTSYQWLVTYLTDVTHETTVGPASAAVVAVGAQLVDFTLVLPPWGGAVVGTQRGANIYRLIGGTYYLEFQSVAVANLAAGVQVGFFNDAALLANNIQPPVVNTATSATVSLTAIALGPAGTTYREVHRTAAGGSQLKLVTTIANNTSTGPYVDTAADSALGINAPSSDTSGLTQPTGQVNAGSTALLTAGAPFPVDGGWVLVGSQCIRYTSVSGNTLAGILSSGPGAITTTIPYGSAVIAVPALTGVNANNGLARAIAKGSTVAIWVERNDLAAQVALGQLELDADGHATDGVHEYLITNGSRGEASLVEEVDADLATFSRPIVSATYDTRDPKSKSGKTVSIDLTGSSVFDPAVFDPAVFGGARFGLTGAFVLQRVDITFDGPALMPRYHVTASSVDFTLMDLLRKALIT